MTDERHRRSHPDSLASCLLEANRRVRSFTLLALQLGLSVAPDESFVRDTAARIRRYFVEALPLHEADQELSLLPRLRGFDEEVDAALDTMVANHRSQLGAIYALLDLCEALENQPGQHHVHGHQLASAAQALDDVMTPHLELEEQQIYSVIDRYVGRRGQEEITQECLERRRSDPRLRTTGIRSRSTASSSHLPAVRKTAG